MISEKLLSKILGYEVSSISEAGNNIEFYMVGPEHWRVINIYELANKCKKWAYDNYKEEVNTLLNKDGWFATSRSYYEMSLDGVYADTEPEATFKVCEWIMKNK